MPVAGRRGIRSRCSVCSETIAEVSVEDALVQIDVERNQTLRLRHCAGRQRLLQLHPQIAGRSSKAGELDTRSRCAERPGPEFWSRAIPGADDDRLVPEMSCTEIQVSKPTLSARTR